MPGWFSTRGRVAALHCSYTNRPPQISGRAQDTTRSGAWDRVLHRAIENLACCCPPHQAVCPVCGFANRFDQQEDTLDPELIFSLTDDVVPATIHGY